MKKLGLLGRNIGYSFSRNYFATKFENEELTNDYSYENFDLPSIDALPSVIATNPDLIGMNVTIPYKEEVLPFLDELSENAKQIGAVNTIKKEKNGRLIGYNTDYFGFMMSLQPLLKENHTRALVLGTGGASKAVVYALKELNITPQLVSRKVSLTTLAYSDLDADIMASHTLIINCTPLGTFPNVEQHPEIPYLHLTSKHIAYDLIYNPEKTTFLTKAEAQGAQIKNGYEMLVLQAEKAWGIWNS